MSSTTAKPSPGKVYLSHRYSMPKHARMSNGKAALQRISFGVTDDTINLLIELEKETEATSSSEVIRTGLRIYKQLLDARKNGHRFFIQDGQTIMEVFLLG